MYNLQQYVGEWLINTFNLLVGFYSLLFVLMEDFRKLSDKAIIRNYKLLLKLLWSIGYDTLI